MPVYPKKQEQIKEVNMDEIRRLVELIPFFNGVHIL